MFDEVILVKLPWVKYCYIKTVQSRKCMLYVCVSICISCVLQSLLQQTESEHPDYYLLLVSVQQLRSFMTQYSHLLQLNQELLHDHSHALREHTHNLCTHQQERPSHTRKELSR